MPRRWLVLAHRGAGLLIAGFLILAGSTGAVLAWSDQLEPLTAPALFVAPAAPAAARRLDPFTLRDRVAAACPDAEVTSVPLDTEAGRTARFLLSPRPGHPALAADEVFADPVAGRIVGDRRWGDIGQGPRNLLPFLLRLHVGLALGGPGETLLGLVALVWTIDCLVGLYLTLPPRAVPQPAVRDWWARWRPAWRVRRRGGYAITFDLHRAGGLWLWLFLLVFAWSSVAMNLPAVYDPLTRATLGLERGTEASPDRPAAAAPSLSFRSGYAAARAALVAELARRGETIVAERSFSLDRARRIYAYRVRASDDVSLSGDTELRLDADTGRVVGRTMPARGPAGAVVTAWIEGLHTADVFGEGYRAVVSLVGTGVVTLSVTGAMIWRRKRAARRGRRGKVVAARARPSA